MVKKNNPITREAIKVGGAVIASGGHGGILAASLVGSLGIAVEALGMLGEKRSRELFDSKELVDSVVKKIQESDDFASFVYSVWQKHNLESSEQRRKYLKRYLEAETAKEANDFENFSRVEYLLQNASLRSLLLLKNFHSKHIYGRLGRTIDPDNARSFLTNINDIDNGLKEMGTNIPMQDLEYLLNELSNYNLIAISHGRFDGPFYNHTKLGFLLLEYINIE